MVKLDLYDKKILFELDINSRISATKISKKIQLSKESVNYRIKRLLKNELIVYFYTMINASMFGYHYYRVSVKMHKHTRKEEEKILNFLLNKKTCTNIRITEGPYDLGFLAVHKNARDFREFLSDLGHVLSENVIERNISMISRSQKFNQKILHPGKTLKKSIEHDHIIENKLDMTDVNILKFLSLKGRAKLTELSENCNVDQKVIRYRIKKMEKTGAIEGYSTMLNHEKLGFNFIQIDFIFKDPATSVPVLEFFDRTKCLIHSYELIGKYDLSIELYTVSDKQLREILDKFKQRFRKTYISYDVSHIFKNFITGWSPFMPEKEIKIREVRIQDTDEIKI